MAHQSAPFLLGVGDSKAAAKQEKRATPRPMRGFLMKTESRPLGGPVKRKLWFAVSEESPFMFWYKNKMDLTPLGRIPLSGAAFTFDPRTSGTFEIHVDKEVYILEASSAQARMQWLSFLQTCRKRHYKIEESTHDQRERDSLISFADEDQENKVEESSRFYLTRSGGLNEQSFQVPTPPPDPPSGSPIDWTQEMRSQDDEVLEVNQKSPKRLSIPLKLPNLLAKHKTNACDSCKELLSVIQTLKERCCDLADENGANRDLVSVLRTSVASAKNQIEDLKQMSSLADVGDSIQYILEKEAQLTETQIQNAEQKRTVSDLKNTVEKLASELSEAKTSLEAYKDSVRSKEALIMKLVNGEASAKLDDSRDDDFVEVGVELGDAAERGPGDFGQLVLVPSETEVEDLREVEQLRDAVFGYQNQNAFLNREVLELQVALQTVEAGEKTAIKEYFNMEAMFYQLKSKYVLLLNHLRPFSGHQNSSGLAAEEVEELIKDATRSSEMVHPQVLVAELETSTTRQRETDALGFYTDGLQSSGPTSPLDLISAAAHYKKKGDDIVIKHQEKANGEHIDWLQKWDSVLVNLSAVQSLTPSVELKTLIRNGIPHNYRSRVWKSLIYYCVKDTMDELGNGYYESLLKKSLARRESSYDSALKQIDLDLSRTLPGNRYFETPDSSKMAELRKVLYAYRWHNTEVGYCQGLNRLAAVALLYLAESDAFWFLVTLVEIHQPRDYYSPTLLSALVDQRVLKDLVQEKLPRVAGQLRQLESDLSLFSLSWFLTCFVDSLRHSVYLQIFDVVLYEGNKVLFRFALAALKLCETQILSCKTGGALHSCLSRIGETVVAYKDLAQIAFHDLNPFPLKHIENRRQYHLAQLKAELNQI